MRRAIGTLAAILAAAALALPAGGAAAAAGHEIRQEKPVQEKTPAPAQEAPPAETPEARPAAETQPAPAAQPGPLELYAAFSRAQLAAAGFTRHQAEVAGHPLVWWEKGTGPALVLIHGVNDQAGTWFQVAPALAQDQQARRVLLVDLPGHGESGPAEGPLPMTTVIEGFETWLAAHALVEGAAPPTLVGNSMGAWVALAAAHRHPEWVGRVVAVNGGPLRPDTGGLSPLPADREAARKLMAALRDPDSPPTPDVVLDDLVRRAPTSRWSRMFAANDDLESWLLEGRLGEIETPVDLLWGEADRYLGADFVPRLLSGLPRARITPVPRCGHLPQAECPERFRELLEAVLAMEPPGEAPHPG
jgi:pimeloyl-ACP methyl ester carboxylesterase